MLVNFQQIPVALGLITTLASASPVEPPSVEAPALTKRMPAFVGCSDNQKKRLEDVFMQLSGYSLLPFTWLSGTAEGLPYDAKKKGFAHYFKPEDKDTVRTAFEGLINAAVVGNFFNVRCASGAEEDCSSRGTESFALAQPWPENMEVPNEITKGQRQLVICPLFWEDKRTKRNLPGDDKNAKKKFCEFPESKRYPDWETGAHTLLHEISHLDEFGKLVGFGELTTPKQGRIPEYKAHGTDDWNGKSDPGNARILRNSRAGNRIPRYQNAESLAAFALELYVEATCGVKDVRP